MHSQAISAQYLAAVLSYKHVFTEIQVSYESVFSWFFSHPTLPVLNLALKHPEPFQMLNECRLSTAEVPVHLEAAPEKQKKKNKPASTSVVNGAVVIMSL